MVRKVGYGCQRREKFCVKSTCCFYVATSVQKDTYAQDESQHMDLPQLQQPPHLGRGRRHRRYRCHNRLRQRGAGFC